MDLVVYLVHEVQRFQDLLVSHQRRSVMAVVVVLVGVRRRGRGVLGVVDLRVDLTVVSEKWLMAEEFWLTFCQIS